MVPVIPGVRRSLAAVAVLAVVVLPVSVAVPPGASAAPTRCPGSTVKQAAAAADSVFRGTVSHVGAAHGAGKQRFRTYRLSADRTYQGTLVTRYPMVTVKVSGTGCVLPKLTNGKRYLVFAHESGSRLVAGAGTGKASHTLTRKVVGLLGSGRQPQTGSTPAAVLTEVAHPDPPTLSRMLAPGGALAVVGLLGLLVAGRLARRTH